MNIIEKHRIIDRFLGKNKNQETKIPEQEKPKEQPKWAKEWDEYVEKTPVGSEIKYLGVTLVITRIRPSYCLHYAGCDYWTTPDVICEYVDKAGVIHEKTFEAKDQNVLIKKSTRL